MASIAPTAPRGARNDAARFGRVSQIFHWTVAALIVTAFVLGLTLDNWPRGNPTRDSVIFVHKSIGITVLLLAIARVAWLRQSPAPAPAARLAVWERRTAAVVHKLLYAVMFLYPLSGIVLSQAAGKPVTLWGIGPLPQFIPYDPAVPLLKSPWVVGAGALHTLGLKFTLIAIFVLHVLGALKHAAVDRDPEMFRRMWGR